jgi:hypothetical protein
MAPLTRPDLVNPLVSSFLGLASKQSESDQGWQWASSKHAQASLADLINGPN